MSLVGVNHIKEEPEWEDYCVSEAQAREAARGVKLEPGAEPPGPFAAAPDTNCKTGDSIHSQSNSIRSSATQQVNKESITVKEESGQTSWPQELPRLYEETNNTEDLRRIPLDLYSGTTEKLKTAAESKELNKVPPVFQTPKVVNSRQDLIVINNIAREVKRKQVIGQEKISRPVTKYVYTPNQQPVMPVKSNSHFNKPHVLNEVTINPEIGLLSQPLKVANALLQNNLVSVKKQSSAFASQAYNQIPLLNSVAYNDPAISRPRLPCPPRSATETFKQPLPTGIFRPTSAPISRPIPKAIFQSITVPISQLNGKVSLQPLKKPPPKTTTTKPKLRPVIVSQFKSDTISKLQPGPISKLQPSTIPTLKKKVLDLQTDPPSFIRIVSNPFDNVKPIYQKIIPDGNDIKKTSITGALKSNITAKPSFKPTPTIPSNIQRIPITIPINSQIPRAVEKSPTPKTINGDKISATPNNSNIQRIATLAPRFFPKTVNSQIAKPIHNHIPQNEYGYRKAEVAQNCYIQRIAPKTTPKASGPVNSTTTTTADFTAHSEQASSHHERAVDSLIPKPIDNDIISGSINDNCQVVTQNLPLNSKTALDTDPSDKVVNLEDFLKPSYVVLERVKKRTCNDCEKTFYEHKAFIDHMRTGQKWEKPVGNDAGIRKDTTKMDSSLSSLTCKYCQKLFSKHKALYYHVNRKHLCRVRKFHCDYCGKKCLERRHLINHIRTHTGEKPYKCLICKTRYRTASNLTSHNINMHGTQKHFCPICDRPFYTSSNLKKHMRTHTGERLYVCEICNKRFTQKHHMTRHMESHYGIRRYTCNTCKKQFFRRDHLVNHEKSIHKKKRPLKKSKKSRQKV